MPIFRLIRSGLALLVFALGVSGCATTAPASNSEAPLSGKGYDEILSTADDAARRGDYRAALMLYGEAQALDNTSEVWLRIGAAQRHLGLLDGAAFAFRSAAELDEANATAHESLGLVLLALREPDDARLALDKALELDAKRWQAHNALGVIADLEGKSDAAIAHYEAALALYPKSQMLLNNLGYSYYLAGDDGRARGYFESALRYGDYEPATLNLGLLHAREGSYKRAVEILAKVVDRPTALNDVGFVAISNGDYDQAQQMLEDAIQLSPVHYETAQRNLALARAGGE